MSTDIYHLQETVSRRQETEQKLRETYDKARKLVQLTGSIGVGNVAKIVKDHFSGAEDERPLSARPKLLRHRIAFSTAPSDAFVIHEILHQNVYRINGRLADRIKNRAIADIGANIGIASAYFATRYPESDIFAFEPHPRNYDLLTSNAEAYGGQIVPVNAAVASEAGIAGAYNPEDNPRNYLAHIFSPDIAVTSGSYASSPAMTGEQIMEKIGDSGSLGIVKVDIEGAEKRVFESGSMDPLLENTEILMVETHDRYIPGSSLAVERAARQAGLVQATSGGHTTIYTRRRH